ncbi:SAM-dependent methyltransferase, partial [Patescibacteria group bacterium]|nr:SAM-dependent methyltransferase [Patescibacteria group bacterium]MBU1868757.1 SAM-dependent methyltransferase [Patescibacteria group bacterium]
QAHLSGWNVDEMKSEGYRVVGINGWRALRGKKAYVHLWPRLFWERVSLITQPITRILPRYAFQILCVKDVS